MKSTHKILITFALLILIAAGLYLVLIPREPQLVEIQRYGTGMVLDIEVSPDDTRFAVASTTDLRIYDLETMELVLEMEEEGWFGAITWSPDSTKIASFMGTGELIVWNARNGKAVERKRVYDVVWRQSAHAVAWSPDGKKIAIGYWTTWHVLDSDTLDELTYIKLDGFYGEANSVKMLWMQDSRNLIIQFFHSGLHLWLVDSAEVLHLEDGMEIQNYLFTKKGNLFNSESEYPYIWEVNQLKGNNYLDFKFDVANGMSPYQIVGSLIYSNDGEDHYIGDLDTDERVFDFDGYTSEFSWTSDQRYMVYEDSESNDIRKLDIAEQMVTGEINRGEFVSRRVFRRACLWTPQGLSLVCGSFYTNSEINRLIDVETQEETFISGELPDGFPNISGRVNEKVSPDGQKIIQKDDSGIEIITLGGGASIYIESNGETLAPYVWSQDSRLLAIERSDISYSAYEGSGVAIYDVNTGMIIDHIPDPGYRLFEFPVIGDMGFSSDGLYFFVTLNQEFKIWSFETQEWIMDVTLENYVWKNDFAWSPTQPYLAYSEGHHFVILDMETLSELVRVPIPSGEIWHIAWSPDGTMLVTTGMDGTVRIWELRE